MVFVSTTFFGKRFADFSLDPSAPYRCLRQDDDQLVPDTDLFVDSVPDLGPNFQVVQRDPASEDTGAPGGGVRTGLAGEARGIRTTGPAYDRSGICEQPSSPLPIVW